MHLESDRTATVPHQLERLLDAWQGFVPLPREEGFRDAFRRFLETAEPKTVMRLAWDSGMERDMDRLFGVWKTDGSHACRISEAYADLARVPQSAWIDFSISVSGPRSGPPFVPLSEEVSGPKPLVHFTSDPRGLFENGFNGTTDMEALSATFMNPKDGRGYNFAFAADGFDAENFAADQFYGSDAILFQARHLDTLNLESMDEEVLFWGGDVSTDSMIHLSARVGGWAVIDRSGEEAFFSGSVRECALAALSGPVSGRALTGPREYALGPCGAATGP